MTPDKNLVQPAIKHESGNETPPSGVNLPNGGQEMRDHAMFVNANKWIVHQGVYSHVCAVCRRKSTRKEHFLRHKCNRRSYLPSRSADNFPVAESETSLPSLVEKVIRSEYPLSDTASPDKQNTVPISVSDSSMEGESLEEQDMAEDLSKIPTLQMKQGPSISNGHCHQAPVAESRRKRTIPRKVIPSLHEVNCQVVDDLSNEDDDDDADDDYFKLQIGEQPPPQLAEISPKDSTYEKFEMSPRDSGYEKVEISPKDSD